MNSSSPTVTMISVPITPTTKDERNHLLGSKVNNQKTSRCFLHNALFETSLKYHWAVSLKKLTACWNYFVWKFFTKLYTVTKREPSPFCHYLIENFKLRKRGIGRVGGEEVGEKCDIKRNIIIIYPLTVRVLGAPQMISQLVSSIFPRSPLPLFLCLCSPQRETLHDQYHWLGTNVIN